MTTDCLSLDLLKKQKYKMRKSVITFWFNYLKSDNLQYNTLGCWVAGTNDSSTKRLIFQVLFFFIISCKILCKNHFNLFYNFIKVKIKSFECPNFMRNNAWNNRLLVDESFVPSNPAISVLY